MKYIITLFRVSSRFSLLADNGERLADNGERLADDGERLADNGERLADNGKRVADDGERLADDATVELFQMAKSVYSGFTASVGGNNIPAATVAFVPCSIKMNEPVSRFVP